MVIHSVTPISCLLYNDEFKKPSYIEYQNGYLEGTQNGGEFLVSRIISTDPKAYLDKNIFPGSTVFRQ